VEDIKNQRSTSLYEGSWNQKAAISKEGIMRLSQRDTKLLTFWKRITGV